LGPIRRCWCVLESRTLRSIRCGSSLSCREFDGAIILSKLKIIAVLVVVIGTQLLTANMAVGNAVTSGPGVEQDGFYRYASTSIATNNLATPTFVMTAGGVALSYRCSEVSGNTQVQITNASQTYAYRTFTAICNGSYQHTGYLNTPANTLLRARIHNYSGQGFIGDIDAWGTGYCYRLTAPVGPEPCV
jgi:hypothetical protein